MGVPGISSKLRLTGHPLSYWTHASRLIMNFNIVITRAFLIVWLRGQLVSRRVKSCSINWIIRSVPKMLWEVCKKMGWTNYLRNHPSQSIWLSNKNIKAHLSKLLNHIWNPQPSIMVSLNLHPISKIRSLVSKKALKASLHYLMVGILKQLSLILYYKLSFNLFHRCCRNLTHKVSSLTHNSSKIWTLILQYSTV